MFDTDMFNYSPYALEKEKKSRLITEELADLTRHHYENCREYRGMLDGLNYDPYAYLNNFAEIPMLPIRLFKEMTLQSVPDKDVAKTMTSSGTSGQTVSKLYLDRETAALQQNVGIKITTAFLGLTKRLPMIIIDCPSVIKSRQLYSARASAVLFYSLLGKDRIYALDDDMNLDVDGILAFLEKHQGSQILMFGFTFMVWQHFYSALREKGIYLDLSKGILIHSGGWKKLEGLGISTDRFKEELNGVCGIKEMYNQYGTAEQSGCVYFECEYGHLHASVFSDVLTRRAQDLSICDFGEPGIIETVSILPKSYPGHVILVEDEGIVLGEDDCPCGRKGKYFKILGRLKDAELRGCSDTYASNF